MQKASDEPVHAQENSSSSWALLTAGTEEDPGWSTQMQAKQQLLPRTQCMAGWGQDGKARALEHRISVPHSWAKGYVRYRVAIQTTWATALASRDSVTDLCWAGARAPFCFMSPSGPLKWAGLPAHPGCLPTPFICHFTEKKKKINSVPYNFPPETQHFLMQVLGFSQKPSVQAGLP